MNKFEKRKLKANMKANIYKHGNAILYVLIFAMAAVITIAAAVNRTDKILYVDEQTVTEEKEQVDKDGSTTNKVAAAKSDEEESETEETIETNTETETDIETKAKGETKSDSGESEATAEESEVTKVEITADTLNVRAEASLEADSIGSVSQGDVYEVKSQDGEWIEIEYEGSEGYINSEYVETVE